MIDKDKVTLFILVLISAAFSLWVLSGVIGWVGTLSNDWQRLFDKL